MAKDRNGSTHEGEEDERREESKRDRHRKSKRKKDESSSSGGSSDSEDVRKKKKKRGSRSSSRRRRDSSESVEGGSSSDSFSDSESESDGGDEEEERKRRKERRREREHEKERKRRKEREREKKRKRDKEKRRKKTDKDKTKKNKEKDLGKTRAVTNLWGKYGIIRETDMWNKRPEFTAWLAEVKKVNLESLANWEEKQMFKEFMEDHNTATFPSKKYYDLDVYYRRKIEKEIKKGYRKVSGTERTVFNDEEQRRQELLIERERQKEEQVETLKRNMQSGMAQAMKEQSRLREEMAYQYKLGNFEAAAAIQKRLDPDVAM